jgi:orotidine-5'-phosphate decarboxylase
VTQAYLERLAARSKAVGTVLCVGLDPDPDRLPSSFAPGARGAEQFAMRILDGALEHAAAVKPNLAFWEAFGSEGLAALERVRARIPGDVPVVLDGKRADIGSTSSRQAVALFDALGADAITVNPYLGRAAIEPLLERADRFAYVLCRTSNPGAEELQGLQVEPDPTADPSVPAEPLWARVARRAAGWAANAPVGLVVGATAPLELRAARAIAPGLAFLVPGLGAQGGDVDAVRTDGRATAPPADGRSGGGLLVNVSRGIGDAVADDDPDAVRTAAARWAARLPVLG